MSNQHQAFRAAVESRDLDALMTTFATDIVLNSPVKHRPFEGKDEVRMILGILLEIFEDFRYTDELRGEGVDALIFRTRVAGRDVEGIDIIRVDDDGLIDDLTVMMRPRSGLESVLAEVQRHLGLQSG